MKINTPKIKSEMNRLGITLEQLGAYFEPKKNRQAIWYLIHNGKSFSSIEKIARALNLDPKDLII